MRTKIDGPELPATGGMKHGGTRKFLNKAARRRKNGKAAKQARRKNRR